MKSIRLHFVVLALLGMLAGQVPLPATEATSPAPAAPAHVLSPEALDKLLAPIALYPDPLLAQILPAATSPSDIVLAARYVAAKKDPEKIDQQPWEESVKALARYPDVLKMMDEKLDWTTELGEAFVAQPKEVFKSVQRLRAKADAVGNLKDSPQQVIVKEKEVIKIMPAQPDVIYVPIYQPEIVYVQQPPSAAATVISFTAGLALGIWIHNELDWHDHHVYYHSGGWHGGNYYNRGGNNVTINGDVNIGKGNGNSGSVWKPQTKPRPPGYGSGAPGNGNNWSGQPGNYPTNRPGNGNNRPATADINKPSASPRPSQTPPRPGGDSRPGFMREGTKPRPANTGGGPSSTQRAAPAQRGGNGPRG